MKTRHFFWRLLLYRPGLYLLNLLAWSLIHMAPLLPGLLTKAFFDHLEGTYEFPYGVWAIAVLLIGAALARIALIFGGFMTDVHFRFRIATLIRRNMLAHVLKEPGARAIPCSPGEAISNFRDDVDQAEEATSWSVDTLGLIGFVIVASWILISIDLQLTVLVFVPLILVVTAAQIATARIQKYRAASRESTAKVTGAISEMFANVQAIQVAGAEKRVVDRFVRLSENRRQSMVKDKLLTEALSSVFTNSVNLGTGLILVLASYKMRNGEFTVGDLSLFVYYLTFVTQLISNVGNFMTYYKQMGVSFKRMVSMLQGAPATLLTAANYIGIGRTKTKHQPERRRAGAPDGEQSLTEERAIGGAPQVEETESSLNPKPPMIYAPPLQQLEARGLTYRYPETGRGIENVSLNLTRGSFTVVTGMIGSGKTTLVRTLLGLLPAEAGDIRWNGERIDNPADFFIPPQSAYTAQIPRLYSDKLRNNILLGIEEKPGSLDRALYAAVMEEDIKHLQDGLETMVGPRGVKLSGGQAQRTAAARMLVRDAELYVFDDLSSALDVETERKLWERLFRERRGATCLVVSHRRAALNHADHIIVLNGGVIEAEGTAEELLRSSESFRQLWYGEETGT
ncbi:MULTISPECIES: ABC transporter ATP-binding protein [Paenibacillus]|uniref:ABC transporter related protein n=2 Tax=Paenibacillus lactis TaxID=228574 RepID=G4HGD0_9BACL|nr:ABC transporter ATP-binding protein [Paenibacillus lactis]EHB63803.1 ABC transporter related protein [Paenibacillus lactis 154]MBP1893574.1 ATP-binding cassette subfamily B protein [Paenibacillus lactis]GIO92168.1 HlyB/MsbA family ABC transporter [Paenibacillus lactis]